MRTSARSLAITSVAFAFLVQPSWQSAWAQRVIDHSIPEGWIKLLHYKRKVFGGWRSDIVLKSFFFANDGATNPVAELNASLEAFSKDPSARCSFPARYRFLKRELGADFHDAGVQSCPKLEQFLDLFHHPKSAALVFSSAYPDNPASMFGHTFLRIDGENRSALLSTGVSYAAEVPPDENTIVFYWKGTTGGYKGTFSVVPYYAKVSEYTHSEARDLWEYRLSLTEEEVQMLVEHIWELSRMGAQDYYFFDSNCSYELVEVLKAVKPGWDLPQPPLWVIPSETVKAVAPYANEIDFRPSYRQQALERFSTLNSSDRAQALAALADGRLPQPSSVAVDNAVSSALLYEKQLSSDEKLKPAKQHLLSETLVDRSERSVGLASPSPPHWNSQPDLGHDAGRLALSGGSGGGNALGEIAWRSAYHDLLDDDLGYQRFSQIEFPSITLRETATEGLHAENIGVLSAISLNPITVLETKPSWRIDLDYATVRDFGCESCHVARAREAVGLSTYPFYGFAGIDTEAGSSLRGAFRGGPSAEAGALLNPFSRYKLLLDYRLTGDLFQGYRRSFFQEASVGQSVSLARDWALRLRWNWVNGSASYQETIFSVFFYF